MQKIDLSRLILSAALFLTFSASAAENLLNGTAIKYFAGSKAVQKPAPGYFVKFLNYYRPGIIYKNVKFKPGKYYQFTASASSWQRGVNGIYIQCHSNWRSFYSSESVRLESKLQKVSFTFKTPDRFAGKTIDVYIFARATSKGMFLADPVLKEIPRPVKHRIVLLSPAFKSNIYHSHTVKNIAGYIESYPEAEKVKVSLRNSSGKVIFSSEGKKFSYPVTSKLADGTYTLRAECFDAAGKKAADLSHKIIKHKKNPSEMIIGQDNHFYRNGKKFYPLLLWGKLSPELRAAAVPYGANIFMCMETTEKGILRELEHARKHNYMLMLKMTVDGYEYPARDGKAYRKRITPVLTKAVTSHPALFGHIIWDEASIKGKPQRQIFEGWQVLSDMDPYHPVYLNESPHGTIGLNRRYSLASDIFGMDIYPVGRKNHGTIGNPASLTCVGSSIAFCCEVVENRKPIFACLQAYAWSRVKKIYPNWRESRFMMYDSFFNGAKGVCYYGGHRLYSKDFVREWFYMLPEAAAATRLFTSGRIVARKTSGDIRTVEIEYAGSRWLIAANYSDKPLETGVKCNFPEGKMPVRFENRFTKVEKGEIREFFLPHDVHVYGGNSQFDYKPSVPQIWLDSVIRKY